VSDLRRWPEEGATADEISLLTASQRERAPSPARSRILRALGLAGVTTAATSSTAAATTATVTKSGLPLVIKLLMISLFGGAVARVVVGPVWQRAVGPSTRTVLTSSATEPTAVESPSAVLSPPPPVVESASAGLSPPPPASSAIRPAVVAPAPLRLHLPFSSLDGRLALEVSALELAHRALSDHDPESALRLLDRYRARFPAGSLAPEETAMRVQALVATGERERAQALADSYSVTHPDSPYGEWLMDLVHGEQ